LSSRLASACRPSPTWTRTIGSKGTSVHRFLTAYGDLVAVSTPYVAGLEFFWFGKPVRSEIFVVKILGTGVALEIDDGSVAKVILK
jgi:hypothetical protein